MRLMAYQGKEGTELAVIDGEEARPIPLADGTDTIRDLSEIIAGGAAELDRIVALPSSGAVAVSSLRPALPLASPGKIICLGLNYVDHAKEGGYDVPDYPALFMRTMSSMVAADEPLVRPSASEKFDYEAELMVIIGKGGRHIAKEDALDHVFGYTLFNDGSVRDYQRKTHQWTPGKNFDKSGSIGPVIVTPDELPAGASGLKIQTRLNGDYLQDANTRDMIFPVADTLAILSEVMTLSPGDMIAMGTPPGVGHARRPPVWMKPGDTVEVEIEKIGILANKIIDEKDAKSLGAAA